ncbi:MAG: MarR family transcriptional regulator [Anaerotignum sp.]|nr:MarR family transcriptional regulator [Anaerotignum sp.]
MEISELLQKERIRQGKQYSDFFFLLHRLNRGYHQHIVKIVQEIGLTKGQPLALLFLDSRESMTQRELCDCLKIKPASMTDILQRMEKNGLILRKRGEKDLRTMRVSITEKGREKAKEFLQREAALDDVFFRGFTPEEKEGFLGCFAKMTENLMTEPDNEEAET